MEDFTHVKFLSSVTLKRRSSMFEAVRQGSVIVRRWVPNAGHGHGRTRCLADPHGWETRDLTLARRPECRAMMRHGIVERPRRAAAQFASVDRAQLETLGETCEELDVPAGSRLTTRAGTRVRSHRRLRIHRDRAGADANGSTRSVVVASSGSIAANRCVDRCARRPASPLRDTVVRWPSRQRQLQRSCARESSELRRADDGRAGTSAGPDRPPGLRAALTRHRVSPDTFTPHAKRP
jgi:hypothetical protein